MPKKLLLFGFDTLPEILPIVQAMKPLAIEVVPVARANYQKPLALLAGTKAVISGSGLSQIPPGGRMIVLCGLELQMDAVLAALRQAGCGPNTLKAILTSSNSSWTPGRLYQELARGHRAMGGR